MTALGCGHVRSTLRVCGLYDICGWSSAVPMQGAEQAIHHSKSKMLAQQSVAAEAKKARVQQLDAYTEGDWNNAVQLGNQDHQWKK